jgi:hypothetical protein
MQYELRWADEFAHVILVCQLLGLSLRLREFFFSPLSLRPPNHSE